MKPMTPNQVREFLPLFQAFAEGKKIEVFIPHNDPAFADGGTWVEEPLPDFNPASKWRVKPEPIVLYAVYNRSRDFLADVSRKPLPVPQGMELVTFREVVQ